MFEKPIIAPSLLSASFMCVQKDVENLEVAGCDWFHVDVMDGHFVPNITMGVPYVSQLRKITDLPIDAHLMVSNPATQIPWFIDAGADIISFHLEALMGESPFGNRACKLDAKERSQALPAAKDAALTMIDLIHSQGVKAAIAIKPNTDVSYLDEVISDLDMVLVMSVEPGFSGQSFIEGSDLKVSQVVNLARLHNVSPLIQVDGGVNACTAKLLGAAGADVFVSGNYVVGATDMPEAINSIRACTN